MCSYYCNMVIDDYSLLKKSVNNKMSADKHVETDEKANEDENDDINMGTSDDTD